MLPGLKLAVGLFKRQKTVQLTDSNLKSVSQITR